MKNKILCLFFVGVITASVCNSARLNSNQHDARAFLQRASSKIFTYYDKLSQEIFESTEQKTDDENKDGNTVITTAKHLFEIYVESKQFDDSKFTDPELKYAFKMIRKYSPYEGVLDESEFRQMMKSMQILEELSSDRDIPAYRNESVDLAFFPDIQDIFARSNDPEELKYYWTTWREKNGVWAANNFYKLVRILKEAAKLNEIPPLEMWLDEYNVTEMEKVMLQIEPFYLQLHGFIRNQLHKKYGDLVIDPKKSIPHHLFEQVLAQAWTSGSIIDDIYPHKDLPPYDEILMQNNFDTLKMFKTADRFYQSLGFNPIPDQYWGTNFMMSSEDSDVGDCKPIIYDVTPNVYMGYCQKMDFRKFLQAHDYMGQLYSAREKSALPAYYYQGHKLQYPVGEAVVLSASTPKHLDNIGLVTEFRFTEEVKMNRLLRMGIHTFLNIPVYFVHTKVMADLFAGSVDITDLNKHYWKIMEKYVGVSPPVDRGEDAYDFPSKFYTDLSGNEQASKFMTEVLGYQFYEKLCKISGQYSRSVQSEPINNCDFYGSKKAGDALKKMLRLGSSKPMREVLATMLPEDPSVNAESLLEYYSSMKSWLIKKNREDNIIVGWMNSKKKVSIVTYYEK